MNRNVFAGKDVITVGEMSSTTIDHCIKYSNPERNELSMTFSFHHLKVDYPNGDKWTKAEFDFIKLKEIMSRQIEMQKGGGWNALFWCNHDRLASCHALVMMESTETNLQNVSDSHAHAARNALYLSRGRNRYDES